VIPFDVAIVGQGIAGTTLAWQLRASGLQVLVVDRAAKNTSSRIAAGLLTPITGQRLAPNWRWNDVWPAAVAFYRFVEEQTQSQFFDIAPMLRLFADAEERTAYEERAETLLKGLVEKPNPPANADWFAAEQGSFAMAPAGRLDVPAYLDASRTFFERDRYYCVADLDIAKDIDASGELVRFPTLNVSARRVIFCQGFTPKPNPYFPDIKFRGAKGEILTLKIPGLQEKRVVHRGIWLMPLGGELFRAGSTYDRQHLDAVPTEAGRAEILEQLAAFVKLPFEVVDHRAAVRPVIFAGRPVIAQGWDEREAASGSASRLGFFNGLGSKGALLAPYFAKQYANFLGGRGQLDPEVDAARQGEPIPKLTEEAHDLLRSVLRLGETAIDATAGNGRDTRVLAEAVGPTGAVFAFDLQPLAIERTTKLLREVGIANVTLVPRDHAELKQVIPLSHHGRIGAITFNLGFLPGGDRSFLTRLTSTLPAIRDALNLLRPGGLLTIVAYTGHPGGMAEATAVRDLLNGLPESEYCYRERIDRESNAPWLFAVTKARSERS